MNEPNDTAALKNDLRPELDERPTLEAIPGGKNTQRPRGFAAMDPALVSQIASKGGKAAHSAGTAHEFTSEEARLAGRKGGKATHAKLAAKKLAAGGQ